MNMNMKWKSIEKEGCPDKEGYYFVCLADKTILINQVSEKFSRKYFGFVYPMLPEITHYIYIGPIELPTAPEQKDISEVKNGKK